MNDIYEDKLLRQSLYNMYVAMFREFRAYPALHRPHDATRMLTALMGARPWSWLVVGITPAALAAYKDAGFKRTKENHIQRGHKQDRAATARALFIDRAEPMEQEAFFEYFLPNDITVLMTRDENKAADFPEFIPIDPRLGLFQCGTLVGFRFGKPEQAHLREMAKDL